MEKRVYTPPAIPQVRELKKQHRRAEFYIRSPLRYEWIPSPLPPQAVEEPPTPPASPPRSPSTKAKPLPVLPPTPERSRSPSPSPPQSPTAGSPDLGETGSPGSGALRTNTAVTVLWVECQNCGTDVQPHELEPASSLPPSLGVGFGLGLGLSLGRRGVETHRGGRPRPWGSKPRAARLGHVGSGDVALGDGARCRYCITSNPCNRATTCFQGAVLSPGVFLPPSPDFDSDSEFNDTATDDIAIIPVNSTPATSTTTHTLPLPTPITGLKLYHPGDSAIAAGRESYTRTDPLDPHSFCLAQLTVQGYNAVVKDVIGESLSDPMKLLRDRGLHGLRLSVWGRDEEEGDREGATSGLTGLRERGCDRGDDEDDEEEDEDGDEGDAIGSDDSDNEGMVDEEAEVLPAPEPDYSASGIEELGKAVKLVESMVSGWWGKRW